MSEKASISYNAIRLAVLDKMGIDELKKLESEVEDFWKHRQFDLSNDRDKILMTMIAMKAAVIVEEL